MPGGINPDAIARKISGKVYLGSNPCVATGAEAKLYAKKVGANIEIVAMLKDSNDATTRVCTADYKPVYADVSIIVRGMQSKIGEIFVKNYMEMGKTLLVFRGKAASLKAGTFKLLVNGKQLVKYSN